MFAINIINLVIVIWISAIIPASFSIENSDKERFEAIMRPKFLEPSISINGQQPLTNERISLHAPLGLDPYGLFPTDRYLGLTEGIKNPVQSSRRKRAWVFSKLGDMNRYGDFMPNVNPRQGVLGQTAAQAAPPRRRPSLLRN